MELNRPEMEEGEGRWRPFSALPAALSSSPPVMAITGTAPVASLEEMIDSLAAMYPESAINLLQQEGKRPATFSQEQYAGSIPAFPDGMFRLAALRRHHIAHARSVGADILIVAYNNLSGVGYAKLRFVAPWMGARRGIALLYAGGDIWWEPLFGFEPFTKKRGRALVKWGRTLLDGSLLALALVFYGFEAGVSRIRRLWLQALDL